MEGGMFMDQFERRNEILRLLRESDAPVSATRFASLFGVTRQVVLSDVALLRASGQRIQATPRGYLMEKSVPAKELHSIVCRHRADQVLDEFYAVVDNGGSIVNVMVEHPIYGQLCADLNIASRFDAQEFIHRLRDSSASQLCDLTGGLHVHMIQTPDEKSFQRIVRELDALGILSDEMREEPADSASEPL